MNGKAPNFSVFFLHDYLCNIYPYMAYLSVFTLSHIIHCFERVFLLARARNHCVLIYWALWMIHFGLSYVLQSYTSLIGQCLKFRLVELFRWFFSVLIFSSLATLLIGQCLKTLFLFGWTRMSRFCFFVFVQSFTQIGQCMKFRLVELDGWVFSVFLIFSSLSPSVPKLQRRVLLLFWKSFIVNHVISIK